MRHLVLAFALFTVSACAQPGHPPAVSPDTVQNNAPHKPKITAAQLLGKSDAWVVEQMGEPTFKRADILANLWQYKNNQCVLNMFLYADETTKSAPFRVLHFDARDAKGNSTDRVTCLDQLQ
ncbi:MAG TPA: hypothetical protein VIN57_02380 [Magnetovibrio sp.]